MGAIALSHPSPHPQPSPMESESLRPSVSEPSGNYDGEKLGTHAAPNSRIETQGIETQGIETQGIETQGIGEQWIEGLVDCPGAQGLYTYRVPAQMTVEPGDIVSVPFGHRQVGAVVIRWVEQLPAGVGADDIRPIIDVVSQGFFPAGYWSLLQRVANYYCTPLIQVVRTALPPGLLGRSQRRIRLNPDVIPPGATEFLQPAAQQILTKLQASKSQDYTWTYLRRNLRGAERGLRDLLQRGWVDSYVEPPATVKPKTQQAVTLTGMVLDSVSDRQQDVLDVLKRNGGDLWLTELLQRCRVSSSVVRTLAKKGAVVIQSREVLRLNRDSSSLADQPKVLTTAQKNAVAAIAQSQGYQEILLHGVTGSGKTEVYLQAIAPLLAQGKSALVLVPEIGLTPQLTDRFVARFGDRVLVYHSALADGERYDTWRQLLQGTPTVIIGTRSAIFLPIPHLGIIILDEEHDSSFKQDRPAPCYHARTVAQWRSQLTPCPLLLGSATPALDTWTKGRKAEERRRRNEGGGTRNSILNPQSSVLNPQSSILNPQSSILNPQSSILNPQSSILNPQSSILNPQPSILNPQPSTLNPQSSIFLSLPTRVHARPHPPIQLVDMRREFLEGHRSIFSRALIQALGQLRQAGQQGILFIHRRGHSTFVSCRSCGYVLECADCDVSLSYHHTQAEAEPYLRCHYCGQGRSHPSHCPACGSPYLKHFGSGTQRVTQELAKLFPDLRFIRYDSDTTRTKGSHRALMNQFAQGDADILVGTQMLTKGIDIPNVTLVGVIAADGLLHMADYRAGERTYQMLTQVAGRAGRGDQPGQVIIQTYAPSHPILRAIQQQQPYEVVMNYELEQRAALKYPPYSQLIALKVSGADPTAVQQTAEKIAARIQPKSPPMSPPMSLSTSPPMPLSTSPPMLQSTSQPESQAESPLEFQPELQGPRDDDGAIAPNTSPQNISPQNTSPQNTCQQPITYELLGPAPAAILRVARRFRWQILLKCPVGMTEAIATHLHLADLHRDCPSGVSLTIDIDPLNLL